jgi:hypothetical protein
MGDRGGDLPHRRDAVGVRQLHLHLAIATLALAGFGAIPVFYIPRALSAATGAEGAASTLVIQFIDAMNLVMRIAGVTNLIATSGQREGTIPCTFGFTESGTKTFNLEVGETIRVLEAFTHAITPPGTLLPALEGM